MAPIQLNKDLLHVLVETEYHFYLIQWLISFTQRHTV